MTTKRAKVAFLTSAMMKERAEFMMSLAPPDLELVWGDQALPHHEKSPV